MRLKIAPYKRKCEHSCDCNKKAVVVFEFEFEGLDDKGLARCENCLENKCLQK